MHYLNGRDVCFSIGFLANSHQENHAKKYTGLIAID